jgi:mandelamide amidase
MQELAFGITSNNAVTGAVRNPWDPTRIPGGSSGGSGAAVAAGLVPVAIGTDTGGSIRVPAALCGVAGFRPTVGRVDGTGIAPISHTRDTAGPLARSVADLALFDAVLTGRATTLSAASLEHVRLGLPQTGFWDDLDDGVAQVALNAIECLREAGATFVPVTMPDVGKLSSEIGFVVALYEFARDMPRYLKDRGTGVTFEALIEEIGSPTFEPLRRRCWAREPFRSYLSASA